MLNLWDWILAVAPHAPALETLVVRDILAVAKSSVYRYPHEWAVPPAFLRGLAEVHGASLRHLILDAAHLATTNDLEFVCARFGALEWLTAHVAGCIMVRYNPTYDLG